MLINVDPILSPDILKTLREMGHGDRLVISDINYPAHSCLLYTSDAADE